MILGPGQGWNDKVEFGMTGSRFSVYVFVIGYTLAMMFLGYLVHFL